MKVEKVYLENEVHVSGRNITLHILDETSPHLKKILMEAVGLITIITGSACGKNNLSIYLILQICISVLSSWFLLYYT